jgi:hypothetical protein
MSDAERFLGSIVPRPTHDHRMLLYIGTGYLSWSSVIGPFVHKQSHSSRYLTKSDRLVLYPFLGGYA